MRIGPNAVEGNASLGSSIVCTRHEEEIVER